MVFLLSCFHHLGAFVLHLCFCLFALFSDNTVKKSDVKKRKAQQQDSQAPPTDLQTTPSDSLIPPQIPEIPPIKSEESHSVRQAPPPTESVPAPPLPPSGPSDAVDQSEAGDTPRER